MQGLLKFFVIRSVPPTWHVGDVHSTKRNLHELHIYYDFSSIGTGNSSTMSQYNCLTHQNSMLIQGGPKVVHFSSHHIFGTVQDKIKRISPKCSDSFWEYRLGCISYAAGKYSLQISSVLVYRKMATFDVINWSYFFAITVRNMRRVSSFFFCYY